jgi:hypothetical protein
MNYNFCIFKSVLIIGVALPFQLIYYSMYPQGLLQTLKEIEYQESVKVPLEAVTGIYDYAD